IEVVNIAGSSFRSDSGAVFVVLPRIDSFTPTSGFEGQQVHILGRDFPEIPGIVDAHFGIPLDDPSCIDPVFGFDYCKAIVDSVSETELVLRIPPKYKTT